MHVQENGWAGISFFYSVTTGRGEAVKIQISSSPRFDKIAREFYPKGKSYWWRCDMVGKLYWRLLLQDHGGKVLDTTPPQIFVVVPAPVTPIELTQSSLPEIPAGGLDFEWSEGKHARVIFYRFKLSEDKTFDHPLINVDGKGHLHHVDKLAPGHYFWKVGVKYTRELPIVYSVIREFTIHASATPAATVVKNDFDTEDDDIPDIAPAKPIPSPEPPPPTADAMAPSLSVQQNVPKRQTSETDIKIAADDDLEQEETAPTAPAPGTATPAAPAPGTATPAAPAPDTATPAAPAPGTATPAAPAPGTATPAAPAPEPPIIAMASPQPVPPPEPPPPPVPPPVPPDLTQPPDQARMETLEADKNLMLQWNSSSQARKFQVEIARSQDFAEATHVTCEPMRLSVTLKPGHFFWRVTAIDERGQKSQPSAIQSFDLVLKKIAITLIYPEKDHSFSYSKRSPPIVFGWHIDAAPDETFLYRLQIARDSSWREIVTERELKGESVTINDLADGNYTWRVGAQIIKDAPVQYSDSGSFVILKKIVLATAPQLTEPADGTKLESASQELPVVLRWMAPPVSRGFVVELADNENFTGAEKFSSLPPTLDIKRGAGRYFWRVKAFDEAGEEGAFSTPRSFSVVRASQSITLKEPAAGEAVGTFKVSFTWLPLTDCSSYRLTVSASSTMESPLRDLKSEDASIQTKLDDEDTYFWTVSCSSKDGQTIKSAVQSFRIVING